MPQTCAPFAQCFFCCLFVLVTMVIQFVSKLNEVFLKKRFVLLLDQKLAAARISSVNTFQVRKKTRFHLVDSGEFEELIFNYSGLQYKYSPNCRISFPTKLNKKSLLLRFLEVYSLELKNFSYFSEVKNFFFLFFWFQSRGNSIFFGLELKKIFFPYCC